MSEFAPVQEHSRQVVIRYALIFLGGALGALLRAVLLTEAQSSLLTLFVINLSGSFALGLLLAALSRLQPSRAALQARSFLGTGVLAGYTSYSALALGVTELGSSSVAEAIGYGLSTVVLGVLCAWLGNVLMSILLNARSGSEDAQ